MTHEEHCIEPHHHRPDQTLTLTPPEMTATAEATFESLIRRVRWSVWRRNPVPGGWSSLEYGIAQSCIDDLQKAYTKIMREVRNIKELHPEFERTFTVVPGTPSHKLLKTERSALLRRCAFIGSVTPT